MKIGEVAEQLGIAPHVLRHWDAEEVVVPDRSTSGHRRYTAEHIRRLQVLKACQNVGMSLAQIRQVLHRQAPGRTQELTRHLERIRAQRQLLEAAEEFLTHVITCRHDLLTTCEKCSAYANLHDSRSRPRGMRAAVTLADRNQ